MKRALLALLIVVGMLARVQRAEACSLLGPCTDITPAAKPTAAALAGSDGEAAARSALAFARSSKPEAIALVKKALLDPKFIDRIMKVATAERCVMPPILRALAQNPAKPAREAFVALVSSKVWGEDPDATDGSMRPMMLLRATAVFRPVTPEIVELWKQRSVPTSGWANVTTSVLADNATAEAVAQFEAMLRDPAFDVSSRISWLHSDLLAHRSTVALLELAGRLLDGKLEAALKTGVIEAVFDYQQQWFGMCPGPERIALATFSPDARRVLRSVGAKATKSRPAKALASAIATNLAELDRLERTK